MNDEHRQHSSWSSSPSSRRSSPTSTSVDGGCTCGNTKTFVKKRNIFYATFYAAIAHQTREERRLKKCTNTVVDSCRKKCGREQKSFWRRKSCMKTPSSGSSSSSQPVTPQSKFYCEGVDDLTDHDQYLKRIPNADFTTTPCDQISKKTDEDDHTTEASSGIDVECNESLTTSGAGEDVCGLGRSSDRACCENGCRDKKRGHFLRSHDLPTHIRQYVFDKSLAEKINIENPQEFMNVLQNLAILRTQSYSSNDPTLVQAEFISILKEICNCCVPFDDFMYAIHNNPQHQ